MMDAIKVLRGCRASGKGLAAGTVYAVPGEVSAADAGILVRMGKAEAAQAAPATCPKPARKRKARSDD